MSVEFAVAAQSLGPRRGLVNVRGEVDIYTAPRLKEQLVKLIDDGATEVVVDLSDVTFIDSTALGVLIGGVRRANAAGGAMTIVVTSRPVKRALGITGLDRVFSLHATRDDAIAALA